MRKYRKSLVFLTILALLLTMLPIGVLAAGEVTINSINGVAPGGSITISGTTILKQVVINIYAPDNSLFDTDSKVNLSGTYSWTLSLPSDAVTGTYKVDVGLQTTMASTTFTVTTASTGDPGNNPPPVVVNTPTPTTAPTATPVPTTVPTPSPTPIVAAPVVAVPTKAPDQAVTQSTEQINQTLQQPVTETTATNIANQLNSLVNNITAPSSTGTTNAGNTTAAVDTINQIATTAAQTTGTAQTTLVNSITSAITTIATSSANITNSTDAVIAAKALADSLKAVNAVSATSTSSEVKATVAATTTSVLNTIRTLASKATDTQAVLLQMDATITAVQNTSAIVSTMDAVAKQTLAENAVKAITATSSVITNVSAADANTAILQVAALVERTSGISAVMENKQAAKDVVKSAGEAIKNTLALTAKTTDVAQATSAVSSLVLATASIAKTTVNAGQEIAKLENNLKKVADSLVEKSGSSKVDTVVQNGKTVAAVSTDQVSGILAKAAEGKKTADALDAKFKEAGINNKVDMKVVLDMGTGTGSNDVKADLPSSLLKGVKDMGLESVEIKAGVASVKIDPEFITGASTAQSVSINTSKIDVSPALMAAFTPDQQKAIESAGGLFDFNAAITGNDGVESKVSKFDKKIEVRIPYALRSGESKDNVTVLYLADDGQIKNMVGKYDEVTGEIVFDTNHFSKYMIKNFIIQFKDIASNFWGKKDVESMASKGIINGRTDEEFDPDAKITRAEFAKLVTVAMGIVDDNAVATFSDVASDAWYSKYVASAANAGIISGVGDNMFAPDANITREQMAAMLARALQQAYPTNLDQILTFSDTSEISSYAVGPIALAVQVELLSGKGNNTLDPKGNATRAEAAAIIYRYFNYK